MEMNLSISKEGLFTSERLVKNKKLLYGAITFLLVSVIGLIIALIVVIQNRRNSDTDVERFERETANHKSLEIPECIIHEGSPSPLLDRANCILDSYPLIDGHNDLSWRYYKYANNKVYSVDLNSDLTKVWNVTHTDIPRLRKGKLGAQFWSCFVDCTSQYKDAVRKSLNQLDTIKKFVQRYPDVFQFVTSAQGILDAFKAGKIGSLVCLEGGHSIDSSLANLRMFYDLGRRLNHPISSSRADNWQVDEPSYNETVVNGITDFGKKIILEMNRLGMMVDLSHVSKKTMIDVLNITKAPVICSHSSAFTICPHNRNVQDDALQMMRENGGVVMVNFYDIYINCGPNKTSVTVLSQVADHIDYIKNVIGVEYVGIGADYDGISTLPVGLEDVSKYPDLFAELIKRGWTDDQLRMLAGKNLIRVFTKVEQVSQTTGIYERVRRTGVRVHMDNYLRRFENLGIWENIDPLSSKTHKL
ncbi:hypothetical protein CHS0354_009337 [Potamilus streckersoni]|uniref:Dipeptidase n=1 Tax=Potamilus streckersoni TaxID=2493646 RepID=A0AAE0SN16_9BIVA|nr:hypothetical protein CHS0354_009337 [Potamilus streckersoni]